MKAHMRSFYSKLCKPALKLLCLHILVFGAFIAGPCICGADEGDYEEISSPMEKSEEEAFYNVMKAINYEYDWRALYPDPCGESGGPQGTSCEELDGLWHLTSLSLGPVYDNTPPCARNASIHTSIAQLTHLNSLSFYQCFNHTNTTIPPQMGTSLRSLTFRNNGALVGVIPATIGGLLNLERLVITGANVEGSIPSELGQLEHLMQLDVSNNKLWGIIPSSLGNLKSLVVLDLSKNYLTETIPPSLGGLSRVEKIDFSRNKLGGWIPSELGGLKGMRLLDMSYNELHGNIPSSFSGLSSLQGLDLSHNSFHGALPITVWSSMRQLMSVDLSNAGFHGIIPSSFGMLKSLRYLSLEDNRLTGVIPEELGRLSNLCVLHLNGNLLSGPLPFTAAFVAQLGSNLQVYGNKKLCSMMEPNGMQGVKGLRICSRGSTAHSHQVAQEHTASSATLLLHLRNSCSSKFGPYPKFGPFPNLLFAFVIYKLLVTLLSETK